MNVDQTGFGVDVGGSSVKGGCVDLRTGQIIGDLIKIPTPRQATPTAIAEIVARIVERSEWSGALGICVPTVVADGVVRTAANIDSTWIGTDSRQLFSESLGGREVFVLNDADCAGIAEISFSESVLDELTIVLTFGTGIGSAIFQRGILLPNSELGHLEVDGVLAENRAAASVKNRDNLSFAEWAIEVSRVLHRIEILLCPTRFIVAGGISRDHEKWIPLLCNETPVHPARFLDTAGVVGAALMSARGVVRSPRVLATTGLG